MSKQQSPLKRLFNLWGIPLFGCVSLSAQINLSQIKNHRLETTPYQWAMIDGLFDFQEGVDLTSSYPCDHFKTVEGNDGEKGYHYEVRLLIPMGEKRIFLPKNLSPSWLQLAQDLISDEYRLAMSYLTGIDLSTAPMEVNLFHYGPSAWLGPHVDLKDKIVTHVLYFNSDWNVTDGGCLAILQSKNMDDSVCLIPPIIGNSSILIRSQCSWHAVLPVSSQCRTSRRSMTVTFYHHGSVSTMWPPEAPALFHDYQPPHD